VRVHDFVIPELGRVTPYGVYDVGQNRGWVSVGIDHDTATFAVESIRRWWRSMGKPVYRQAQRLLITADSGGSNGSRARLWKLELQKLANETGLRISVCHLPPGTSKWNKIEHRLFFLHQPELAWQALGEPRSHCEFDFRHNHSDRFKGARKARYQLPPARSQGVKKADRRDKYSSRLVLRRMELYNPPQYLTYLMHFFRDEP
jgi:Rhodopirellula transposase DDE domain